MANRPQSLEDRRANLSDRMTNGREDWQQNRGDRQDNRQENRGDRQGDRQDNRGDRQDDRQDWREGNREDWQDWADNAIADHGDWYHDCWHGDWYPGAGWGYMWDNYPVAAAFGLTSWGVNRLAYGWGYYPYENPYVTASAGYDYSQPLVVYADSGGAAAAPDAGTAAPPSEAPQPSDEGMAALAQAREAFRQGQYDQALADLDTTLKTMPNDAAVHEFRSLVLFALKKYPESAAAIYAVLSAGPGWDWTTMSGLYGNPDDYTNQLRALEDFSKANPRSPDAHFLLGYHYLTTGFAQNASQEFKLAEQLLPNDRLVKQLVGMTTPPDARSSTPPPPAAEQTVPPEKMLTAEKLTGEWKAASEGANFELDLKQDGTFVWTFARGSEKQSVNGVFAVDQNNLALEPATGGTMLAEVDFANPGQFQFKMIGGDANDPGLQFKKG
jgi:tetratricopeptide (TPR) repeat protein